MEGNERLNKVDESQRKLRGQNKKREPKLKVNAYFVGMSGELQMA